MNKAIEQTIRFTGTTAAELFDIFLTPEKHSLKLEILKKAFHNH